ncbi:MAG: flagellar biosynthesis protein FlgD, partial [Hyphomonadaceae bacterium]|nr:flagellar biosynthesis protein FlgD [Hyphomonadaceae bacterium]
YAGAPVEFTADLPETTDRAVLTVRNADGEAILTQTLKSKSGTYSWDGNTESGEPADPGGIYQFSIDVYGDDAYLGTIAPRVITTVTEVGSENGTLRFGTSSHLTTDANNVRKVDD